MGLDRKLKKLVIALLVLIILAGATTAAVFIVKSTKKPKHTHVFDQKIETVEFVKDFAKCETYATYYYACKCNDNYYESSKTYLDADGKLPNGEIGYFTGESEKSKPTGHTKIGGDVVYNATCLTDGKLSKVTCGVCGKTLEEEKVIKAFGHNWNDVYSYENGKHWRKCRNTGCTAITDEGTCSGGTATCTAYAECTVCHNKYGQKDAEKHSAETYRYEMNKNGTHKVIHACCDAVENEAEECNLGGWIGNADGHHKTCGTCSWQTPDEAHTFTETGCTVCGMPKYGFIFYKIGEKQGYMLYAFNDNTATFVVIDDEKIDKNLEGYEKKIIAISEYAFDTCTNLTQIFYKGTKAEWEAIEGATTAVPQGATVYYYSDVYVENQDTWHYEDGVPTVNTAHVHFTDVTAKQCSCGLKLYEKETIDGKITLTKCNGTNVTEVLISSDMVSFPPYPVILQAIAENAFANCNKLETIFFYGSEADWNALGGNKVILPDGAKVYFYSEDEESLSGNRWYYDENRKPKINDNSVGKT